MVMATATADDLLKILEPEITGCLRRLLYSHFPKKTGLGGFTMMEEWISFYAGVDMCR